MSDVNKTQRFIVIDGPVAIRDRPQGRLITTLSVGEQIVVDPDSRTEIGGYIWWKHRRGWSAERNEETDATYLESLTSPQSQKPVVEQPLPDHVRYQVQQTIAIRDRASESGIHLGWLRRGTKVTIMTASLTEAEDCLWAWHPDGWSKIETLDGNNLYMAPASPETPPIKR